MSLFYPETNIYKMDYAMMLAAHKRNKADATISVFEVPIEEASRFGIMNTNEDGSVYEFEEKPAKPKIIWPQWGLYFHMGSSKSLFDCR